MLPWIRSIGWGRGRKLRKFIFFGFFRTEEDALAAVRSPQMIPPDTAIGRVRLRVADIDDLAAFYERVIGLRAVERDGEVARLGPEGGEPLIELVSAPDGAPPRRASAPGLFHLAILVPDRAELARSLQRAASAGWRLTGASDHLVTRRSTCATRRATESRSTATARATSGAATAASSGWRRCRSTCRTSWASSTPREGPANGMPADTTMGHVHLQVADIPAAEGFYNGALGLDVMVRSYPGALFLAAGGYHHHLGLNTWQSEGAPPPPEGALGLDRYEIVLPDEAAVDTAAEPWASAATRSGWTRACWRPTRRGIGCC